MPLNAANGAASSQYIVADLTPPGLHDRRRDWQDCSEAAATAQVRIGCPRETFLIDVEEVTPRRMQRL